MDADELSVPVEAVDRAVKGRQFAEIEALLNPSDHEMSMLVRTVNQLASESGRSAAETASLMRDFVAAGFDAADACKACQVAVRFDRR